MMVDQGRGHYPGRLIAVEGLDGSGKSTQLYLLKRCRAGKVTEAPLQKVQTL